MMNLKFKKVIINIITLPFIYPLVPNAVLSIYPRKDGTHRFSDAEIKDFDAECHRTKNLVDRVPLPNRNRQLDPVTYRLGQERQVEFHTLGNELLVTYFTWLHF